MIKRELTNLYLAHVKELTETLYECWKNSYCDSTEQIIKSSLSAQITRYGCYEHTEAIKSQKLSNVKSTHKFKNLTWVNKFTKSENLNTWNKYYELHQRALDEIENNLFALKDKSDRIAYSNILLRNIDKSQKFKLDNDKDLQDKRYLDFFELILTTDFNSESNTQHENNDNIEKCYHYSVPVCLYNHFEFLDNLIDIFSYFQIDLNLISEGSQYNLYQFNEIKKTNFSHLKTENYILPKFNSPLSDGCLIRIMHHLLNKKKLSNTNVDAWLFWFNRNYIKAPEPIKWKGSPTLLSNIIQHICGESISKNIKTIFCTNEYAKPTRKEYEKGKMYKEIEQIITISNKINV